MKAAVHQSFDPVNGDFEAVDGETTSVALERRLKRRRQVMMVAVSSHAINIGLLLIFAIAGTIPFTIVTAFALCTVIKTTAFFVISERGLSNDWNDHFFAIPYTTVTCAVMLGFIYAAPQVAIVFLNALLLIANVIAFRASTRLGIAAGLCMSAGMAALYLLADLPLTLPAATVLERIGTLLTFAATIGRTIAINVFASRLRDNLYRRSTELEMAYKRIEELAEVDELTGVLNRRSIMRWLEGEVRTQSDGAPCSVALIDLDWFKRINDRFGHLTGDEVLRTFAITIFANIRNIDKFGRFGGEEFLLIMPDTPHDRAVRMLERLRTIVEQLDWSAFSDGLNVTISAGIATLGPGEGTETLLARADTALYAAKEHGRNRITAA